MFTKSSSFKKSLPSLLLIATGVLVMALLYWNRFETQKIVTQSSFFCADQPQILPASADNMKNLSEFNKKIVAQYGLFKNNRNSLSIKQKLYELLNLRKRYLVAAVRENSSNAKSLIFDKGLGNDLKSFTTNCVEEPVSVSGNLEVRHFHNITDNKTAYSYAIKTDQNKKVFLYAGSVKISKPTHGDRVAVQGLMINKNEVLFSNIEKEEKPNNLKVQSGGRLPFGDKKILALLIYFQDQNRPMFTKDLAVKRFESVENFYKENSYQKLNLKYDVYGWYQLPIPAICSDNSTLNGEIIDMEALKKFLAENPGADLGSYDMVYYVIPYKGISGCGNGGGGTLGAVDMNTPQGVISMPNGWTELELMSTIYTTGHETGHMLGHHHANSVDCISEPLNEDIEVCIQVNYGNIYSIMGTPGPLHHDTLMYKEQSGWVDDAITTVTTSGQYMILPLESQNNGIKGLKIPRTAKDYLYVEYRQPMGFDMAPTGMNAFQGVQINVSSYNHGYLVDPSSPPFQLNSSALLVGEELRDPLTGTIIKLLSKSSNGAQIDVKIGKNNYISPDLEIESPRAGITVAQNQLIDVRVSDDENQIQQVEYYIQPFGESKPRLVNVARNQPYDYMLPVGNLENQRYQMFAVAYDKAGEAFDVPSNKHKSNTINFILNKSDNAGPQINLGQNQGRVDNPVTIAPNVSDVSGIDRVEFYLENSAYPFFIDKDAPYQIATQLPLNIKSIVIKAYDKVGNVAENRLNFEINNAPTEDRTAPTVTILPFESGNYFKGDVNVRAEIADNLSTIASAKFYLNTIETPFAEVNNAPFSALLAAENIKTGAHTIKVVATDSAGNQSIPVEIPFVIDHQKPVPYISSPEYQFTRISGKEAEIGAFVIDDYGVDYVEFYLNGSQMIGRAESISAIYSIVWDSTSVPNGIVSFSVEASDLAGNKFRSKEHKLTVAN